MLPDVTLRSNHDIIHDASIAAQANGHRPLVLTWLAMRRRYGDTAALGMLTALYGADVGYIVAAWVRPSISRKLARGWTYRLVPPAKEKTP